MEQQNKFYLTSEGLKRFEKEYAILRDVRLAKAGVEMPSSWQSEDLNPEYLSFQEDLEFVDRRLAELENILKNSELIKAPSKTKRNLADIGATVLIESGKQKDRFVLVSTLEADPVHGKISVESPLGRALLGKTVGEEAVLDFQAKTVYKIKNIDYKIS